MARGFLCLISAGSWLCVTIAWLLGQTAVGRRLYASCLQASNSCLPMCCTDSALWCWISLISSTGARSPATGQVSQTATSCHYPPRRITRDASITNLSQQTSRSHAVQTRIQGVLLCTTICRWLIPGTAYSSMMQPSLHCSTLTCSCGSRSSSSCRGCGRCILTHCLSCVGCLLSSRAATCCRCLFAPGACCIIQPCCVHTCHTYLALAMASTCHCKGPQVKLNATTLLADRQA